MHSGSIPSSAHDSRESSYHSDRLSADVEAVGADPQRMRSNPNASTAGPTKEHMSVMKRAEDVIRLLTIHFHASFPLLLIDGFRIPRRWHEFDRDVAIERQCRCLCLIHLICWVREELHNWQREVIWRWKNVCCVTMQRGMSAAPAAT